MRLSEIKRSTSGTLSKKIIHPSHALMLKAGLYESSESGERSLTFMGEKILKELEEGIKESFSFCEMSNTLTGTHKGKKGGLMYIDNQPGLRFSFACFDSSCMNSSHDRFVDMLKDLFLQYGLTTCTSGCEQSTEIFIKYDAGRDRAAICENCGYSENVDFAKVYDDNEPFEPKPEISSKKLVHTPGATTVDAVCDMIGCKPCDLAKTLILSDKGTPIIAVIRGDRELSVFKLKQYLNISDLELADAEMIERITGAETGYASPIGLDCMIISDNELKYMTNFVTGANRSDYHYINVNISDFAGEGDNRNAIDIKGVDDLHFADIRKIKEGDSCPVCNHVLDIEKVVKTGCVKNEISSDGYFVTCEVELFKSMLCIIEQNHDDAGIIWPKDALYTKVYIIVVNMNDDKMKKTAHLIYERLMNMKIGCILDDTDVRAGTKFYNADLLGIHYRITVGNKISQGLVELKQRNKKEVIQGTAQQVIDKLVKELS